MIKLCTLMRISKTKISNPLKNTQFTLVNRVFSFIQSVIICRLVHLVPMHYLANHLLQCLPKCLRQAEW